MNKIDFTPLIILCLQILICGFFGLLCGGLVNLEERYHLQRKAELEQTINDQPVVVKEVYIAQYGSKPANYYYKAMAVVEGHGLVYVNEHDPVVKGSVGYLSVAKVVNEYKVIVSNSKR